jgi:hypothetical protein
MFWGLYWVWKHYSVKADFASLTRILAASGLAAVAAYFSVNFISIAEWVKLVVGCLVFLIVYMFAAPLSKAVVNTDIENLRTMTSGLGIISKIAEVSLALVKRVADKCYAEKSGTSAEQTNAKN